MSDLIQDVWHDLREKRLWPVAVALLLGIVAIPALLTKSAAQPAPSQPAPAAAAPAEQANVRLDDSAPAATGTGSSLDGFSEGDPFTPPAAIAKRGDAVDTASAADAGSGPTGSTGGGADGGTGGGGLPPDGSFEAPDLPPPTTRTETAEYQYVANVTFWTGDRRRQIRGLRKLDMLPNEAAPVLIFMGTSAEGGNAVFLVDSTLRAAGEGRCVPSAANCAYVHVGPGSEHAFTTEEGDSYRLRVDEIRRVKVKAEAGAARAQARAAVGADAPAVRRFQLPALIDLVAVSTTTTSTEPAPPAADGPSEQRSSMPRDGR